MWWRHFKIHLLNPKSLRFNFYFNGYIPGDKINISSALVQATTESQIAKFMGSTWGPPGSCRPQICPMLGPWSLLWGTCLEQTPYPHPSRNMFNLVSITMQYNNLIALTYPGRLMYLSVSKLRQHWFRWLDACMFSAKPLSETMLAYYWVDLWESMLYVTNTPVGEDYEIVLCQDESIIRLKISNQYTNHIHFYYKTLTDWFSFL